MSPLPTTKQSRYMMKQHVFIETSASLPFTYMDMTNSIFRRGLKENNLEKETISQGACGYVVHILLIQLQSVFIRIFNVIQPTVIFCMYRACLQTLCFPFICTQPRPYPGFKFGWFTTGAPPRTKISDGGLEGDSDFATVCTKNHHIYIF